MTNDTLRDLRQRAEDAAYTAVGVGVLGFQHAQVRRRAAQQRLVSATHDARTQAVTLSRSGQTQSPWNSSSSPVFTMAVTVAGSTTPTRPHRKRAAPTPPASAASTP